MELFFEFYPRGCYLLVLGDLWKPSLNRDLDHTRRRQRALGDLAALLMKRVYSLTLNFEKKTFLVLDYFT